MDVHTAILPEIRLPEMLRCGRFKIKEHVGSGSRGDVYRAVDTQNRRVVAVKIGKENDKQIDYLMNEVKALQYLEHKNVVRLLCYSFPEESTNDKYIELSAIVLEECICDLAEVMRIFPRLTYPVIKTMAKQILQGLECLETAQIIHCDVKPANMLLSYDGNLKLCDFGFAMPSRCCDKPGFNFAYSPLEAILGARNLDPTVDSWSAGIIMVELFLEGRLFTNRTAEKQMSAVFELCGLTKEDWEEIRSMLPGECYNEREEMRYRERTLDAKLMDFVHDGLAREVISQLLVTNPKGRSTASQALTSRYFGSISPPLPDLQMLANLMERRPTSPNEDNPVLLFGI